MTTHCDHGMAAEVAKVGIEHAVTAMAAELRSNADRKDDRDAARELRLHEVDGGGIEPAPSFDTVTLGAFAFGPVGPRPHQPASNANSSIGSVPASRSRSSVFDVLVADQQVRSPDT